MSFQTSLFAFFPEKGKGFLLSSQCYSGDRFLIGNRLSVKHTGKSQIQILRQWLQFTSQGKKCSEDILVLFCIFFKMQYIQLEDVHQSEKIEEVIINSDTAACTFLHPIMKYLMLPHIEQKLIFTFLWRFGRVHFRA